MTQAIASTHSEPARRIIVALDVPSAADARAVIDELRGQSVGAFKIGLQLFTSSGPDLVRDIAREHRVFLDLKYHDIPNTVAKAGVEAARLGVWMFNVHASGGREMMRRTLDEVTNACENDGIPRPLITGVTVLTSSDANTMHETGIESETAAQVLRLARLASECGLDGVIASPQEIAQIRAGVEKSEFLIATPGVRPDFATKDDQKRVMTPRQAVSEGADYIVIGRPIIAAQDRAEAFRRICEDVAC